MGNLRMNADQISYKGGNKPMSVEQAIKNAGNTGLAHTADIAPDFSTETAYNAGDMVYYNGSLYKFTANHSAGAWSTSDTQAVTVGGEIETLTGEVADLYSGKANQITIAQYFNPETAYAVGDLVYYNGLSYRCVNSHDGAWDADDFAATTIANELSSLMSGLINLHYRKIAESESTGTYADKLGTISTTYSTLSSEQKKSAKLVRNAGDYFNAVNNSGAFSAIYLDNNDLVITCFMVAQGEYIYTDNGNKTDASNVSDGSVLSLWVCE